MVSKMLRPSGKNHIIRLMLKFPNLHGFTIYRFQTFPSIDQPLDMFRFIAHLYNPAIFINVDLNFR